MHQKIPANGFVWSESSIRGKLRPMAMQRRELLIGAGAAIATATAGQALAAQHQGHGDHEKHGKQDAHATPPTPARVVFDNSVALGVLGELCITFCFEHIPKDTALLECAITAKEMIAVNAAVGELAVMDSPRLGGVARAALAVYDNCEEVCRKHEAHHEICRQCADQCTVIKTAIAALT